MADDRDRRDTDRAPQLMDADLPEEDTAPHDVPSLEEVAREQRVALSAAHHAVGLLAGRLMEIFDAQRRIEKKVDSFSAAVGTLSEQLAEYRAQCAARHGNGYCSEQEFPSGRG